MSDEKPWLAAILVVLVTLLGTKANAPVQEHQSGRARAITLSRQSPQAAFPLDEQRVKQGRTTVLVQLIRADNPDHAEFTVDTKLSDCSAGAGKPQVPVGSLGTYPAGQTGGRYALDLGPALKQISAAGQPLSHTCLKLLLKPLHPSTDWKRLRVTVSAPQWKDSPENVQH
jgi:hypothetical protein